LFCVVVLERGLYWSGFFGPGKSQVPEGGGRSPPLKIFDHAFCGGFLVKNTCGGGPPKGRNKKSGGPIGHVPSEGGGGPHTRGGGLWGRGTTFGTNPARPPTHPLVFWGGGGPWGKTTLWFFFQGKRGAGAARGKPRGGQLSRLFLGNRTNPVGARAGKAGRGGGGGRGWGWGPGGGPGTTGGEQGGGGGGIVVVWVLDSDGIRALCRFTRGWGGGGGGGAPPRGGGGAAPGPGPLEYPDVFGPPFGGPPQTSGKKKRRLLEESGEKKNAPGPKRGAGGMGPGKKIFSSGGGADIPRAV